MYARVPFTSASRAPWSLGISIPACSSSFSIIRKTSFWPICCCFPRPPPLPPPPPLREPPDLDLDDMFHTPD
jgi:hypothetical protein